MATAQVFYVTFRVVKLKTGTATTGTPYAYTRDPRTVLIQAASIHPKDLLATLNADIALGSGESIEVLSASQYVVGTEGPAIYE